MDLAELIVVLAVAFNAESLIPDSDRPLADAILSRLAERADLTDSCDHWRNWIDDVSWVRSFALTLADAPSSADVNRLPSLVCCETWRDFHRDRQVVLEAVAACLPSRAVAANEAISEARAFVRFWDLACLARQETCKVWQRRQYLREMRELVGEEDYAAWRWPAVPWRWFQQQDR